MEPSYTLTWRLPDGSERATDAFRALNLLGHADMFGLTIPQACGGQAECGTCRVQIQSGELTPCRGEEAHLMTTHRRSFEANERLACQARPRSDVTVVLRSRQQRPPDLRDTEIESG